MEQFNDPQFSVIALTAAINDLPFVPGQLGALDIFEEDGQASTTVKVERQGHELSIIEPSERGGPGQTVGEGKRDLIPFEMDHFEINDTVMADEVQGVRQLGSDDDLETIQSRIDSKQDNHARRMDTTLEHSRIGAIKGLVSSGQGRVLHNLYDRFEIPVPAAVQLGIGAGDVADLDKQIKDNVVYPIEDELDQDYGGIHSLTGRDFHSHMWLQKVVRETFLGHSGADVLRQGVPDKFSFAGITWERYRTGRKARDANGGAGFIAPDEARVFPVGVAGLYLTRFGPADYEETVNTIGLPRYTRQYAMANGKGRHLDSQSNYINLCTKPGALRRLTIAAAA